MADLDPSRFQLPPDPSSEPGLPPSPPPSPPPAKPSRFHPEPGWISGFFMILSIVGMIVFSPILHTLRTAGDDLVITGSLILRALGFVLCLVVFGATLGVRVVHWLAQQFVDLLFGWNSGPPVKPSFPEEEEADDVDRDEGS